MKRGFLLMNTGSPEVPEEAALRVYLKELLMDPHVIDLPWPLRAMLVHGLILPRRPAESAKAYATIWTENGSPLVHYCTELANGLNVEVGMAYGKPAFKDAVEKLLADGIDEVCLLPMFPHYAMATTGSCIAGVKAALNNRAALRVAPPFFDEPTFIQPLAESLAEIGEHILFTFHGLPERHLEKDARTANYRIQCLETSRLIATAAGIPEERYTVSFQSRLGRAKWLEPYTEETLRNLPAAGKKRLAVICPSFFCDCLETLEEIEIRGKETFLAAGGESFRMIPCLNNSPSAFRCLETLMVDAGNWNEA
ncbi:MAG: ferrochelatase [Verrucomicrobia bacterium]|nr:ferrochelatase [Verrucomicrobiota bacterium]